MAITHRQMADTAHPCNLLKAFESTRSGSPPHKKSRPLADITIAVVNKMSEVVPAPALYPISSIAPLIPSPEKMPKQWLLPSAQAPHRLDLVIVGHVPGLPSIWNIYSVTMGLIYTALNVKRAVPAVASPFNTDLSDIRCVPVAHKCGILLDVTATAGGEEFRYLLWVMVLNHHLVLRPCHGIPRIDRFLQVRERCSWVLQRAQLLAPARASSQAPSTTSTASGPDAGSPEPMELLVTGAAAFEATAAERELIAAVSEMGSPAPRLAEALTRLRDLLYIPETAARLASPALYYARRLCCHGDAAVRAAALDLINTL